ncbi:MAG: hypothetical protein U0746_06870 [Gemmataceae bacterium]
MKTMQLRGPWTATLVVLVLASVGSRADVVINNGGFEAGFASWIRADQTGSNGTFLIQTGLVSPVNGTGVPTPPGGTRAAMSDAQGPGTHVLYQDFVVPPLPIASAILSFDVFVGNRASAFFVPSPASLDFSTPTLNQQARVDILRGGTDPFSVSALDLLTNAYQTQLTDPLVSGYTHVTANVTALLAANAGTTLRLRFAEADNVSIFQFGVDNVSLVTSPVPEPPVWVLACVAAAAGFGCYGGRRARSSADTAMGPQRSAGAPTP